MSHEFPTTFVRVYPAVTFGADCEIGDFVILGAPARGKKPGERATQIGPKSVLRSHSVVYAGTTIGARFQLGHGALVREDCQIGDDCSVGSHTVIEFQVHIANKARVHSQAFIPEHSVLEEGCWIGPRVTLTNAKYPAAKDTKDRLAGVVVGAYAKVGANATLLPGVRLGEHCLVGAGAVVTRNVPPGMVVVGNPGRIIKRIEDLDCESYREALGVAVKIAV